MLHSFVSGIIVTCRFELFICDETWTDLYIYDEFLIVAHYSRNNVNPPSVSPNYIHTYQRYITKTFKENVKKYNLYSRGCVLLFGPIMFIASLSEKINPDDIFHVIWNNCKTYNILAPICWINSTTFPLIFFNFAFPQHFTWMYNPVGVDEGRWVWPYSFIIIIFRFTLYGFSFYFLFTLTLSINCL